MEDDMKIFYRGWVGHGNLGDDITYEIFKRHVNIPNLSHYENYTHDYVIYGGGTHLAPSGSLGTINYFNKFGHLPHSIFGTSIEEIYPPDPDLDFYYTDNSIRVLNNIIQTSDLVCLRDNRSLSTLNYLNIHRDDMVVVGDLSFLQYSLPTRHIHKSNKIGINIGTSCNKIYGNNEEKLIYDIISMINSLILDNKQVYMIPVWTCDLPIQNKICDIVNNDKLINIDKVPTNLLEWKSVTNDIDIFIGMKLHSIICSLLNNIPSISIAYREKCIGIMEILGLEDYYVKTDDINLTDKCLMLINKINHSDYIDKFSENILYYKNISKYMLNNLALCIRGNYE